ncbi:MAG TPA: acyl carrier protein [Nocardioides sp.]|nr:acyl carrier protein [Nocardioides sp.]
MTTDVPQGIAGILAEVLDIDADTVRPDQVLRDLGVDMLALIEVVVSVEQTFGVVIADDDARGLTTVAALTSYVEQRLP